MRITVSLLAVLWLAPFTSAQLTCPNHPDLPSSPQDQSSASQKLDAPPARKYSLQGTIGTRAVRMYLNQDGPDSDGLFYIVDGNWTPVFLFGDWKPGGFDFAGESKNDEPIGRFQGRLADNVVLGQWTPTGSDHGEPVRLSVVPKTECDGKGEWKRFDSPKWPFSFSYPASWNLVEEGEGNYIRLICPDPEDMTYDNDVTVSEGVGEPTGESQLVRCGKSWRYDASCDEDIKDSLYNHVPTQSIRHGKRIFDISSREWRVYCRNRGYVGQGEGLDQVVLLPTGWIRITDKAADPDFDDRLIDSIRAHSAK